jgi:hypothetical protein
MLYFLKKMLKGCAIEQGTMCGFLMLANKKYFTGNTIFMEWVWLSIPSHSFILVERFVMFIVSTNNVVVLS